jgi:catechol 2,3-dioxygenase-like lactoylglutathione lyase family enzyme
MATRLRTLVLRCADIDRSQRFYSALGLEFGFEQRGDQPGHYSAEVDGMVLELYPVDATRSLSGPSVLRFDGPRFHELSSGDLPKALGRPRLGEEGLRFVDPDGRIVWMLPPPGETS